MEILDHIEKLQKKPRHVREKILAVSVTIVMILIAALWIQTTRFTFSAEKPRDAENPLKVIWGTAVEGFTEATKQLNRIKN